MNAYRLIYAVKGTSFMKKRRQFLSVLMVCCLAAGILPAAASAAFAGTEAAVGAAAAEDEGQEVLPTPAQDGGESAGQTSVNDDGASPMYAVTVADADHGTVTVNPSSASKGATVTVTLIPDDGYTPDALIVFDATNKVPLVYIGENQFTFTMSGSAVLVRAEFVPIPDTWANPYTDVSKDIWYYDAVKYVTMNNLMDGCGDGVFAPNEPASRGMIAAILYRLEGRPAVSGASAAFNDVADGAWYADAVAWAAANGIMSGYDNGSFGTNDPITRQDLAVTLFRYASCKGYDVTASADLSGYADASAVRGYAGEAMRWANAVGLITGTDAAHLSPADTAARSQIAAILMRFCEM